MMRELHLVLLLLSGVCLIHGYTQQDPVAAEVLKTMDQTINPCNDFFQYACGGWLNSTVIPPDKNRVTRSFTTIGDHNEDVLLTIVSSQDLNLKIYNFYNACMDIEHVDNQGYSPMLYELQKIEEVVDVSSLMRYIADANVAGLSPFFTFSPIIDPKNPSINIAMFDQGGLSLPYPSLYTSSDPNDAKIRVQYQNHMINMFTLINDPDPSSSSKLAYAMEQTIATFTIPPDELTNPFTTYNPMSIDELKSLAPSLSWDDFFGYYQNINVTVTGNLTVTVPTFFSNLSDTIIASHNNWKPYLRWKLLTTRSMLLSQKFRDEHFNFFGKILGGQSQPTPRWKSCISSVDISLGELLGKYFVEKSFSGSSEADAVVILTGILGAMKTDLNTVDWMDSVTRDRALLKLSLVTYLIGAPANPDTYDGIIVGVDYYTNMVTSMTINNQIELQTIGKPSDKMKWGMTAPTVNAYYDPSRNQMVFPAGILQQPFFNQSFPTAMNYGGIGMVMGHELTHGFDNQGRLYDGNGVLTNWWEPATSKEFDDKVQCIIDQYSKFEIIPGVYVNGKLTQGENVADCGGIHNAYNAFSQAIGSSNLNQTSIVPGLNQGQLFFVAFAQTWCTKATDNYYRISTQTDPHSPAKFRVMGPLQNLASFSNTFQCPAGSVMNPANKCIVW